MGSSGTIASLFIALAIVGGALFILLSVLRVKIDSKNPDVVDLINTALKEDLGETDDGKPKGWSDYWDKLIGKTGRKFNSPGVANRIVLTVIAISAALGFALIPGTIGIKIVGAFVVSGLSVLLLQQLLKAEVAKRTRTLSKQLPMFITTMRTQLQGNKTIHQAIINSVDDIPEPLKSELIIVKKDLESGSGLTTALNNLSKKTDMKELEFLIAAISIAASSGSDLEPQLKKIEEILDNRRKIDNAVTTAVAQMTPTKIVAMVTIPGVFAWSYLSSADNRLFWYSLLGVVFMVISAALYAAGLVIFNALISNLRKKI